ncbi:glycosyltransferase family 39 protein [Hymenobacter sp. NBH84]|uniref:glycosyltransferase family 39 protein n=1 Tax=Hymenobacter sp. NBH84 TaxID=2596915 RepID=UPI00162589C5|nr:glycosyltransferase family 39 protein [Hymenobacter sp. NBH84]
MLLSERTDSLRKEKLYQSIAVCLFIGLALVFNAPYLSWLPRGLHEWAQSDRLALALGYYDYQFDFFHPRTLSLVTVDRVTGTELPLQAYIASLFGLLVGRQHITVAFRCLDLAMMVVGFYYLFRLMYESTGNFVAGLVPAAFLLGSPIFIYYSGNYTPDPFSASLLFVAIYHYWRFYYRDRQFRHLIVATVLAGLAMLVKVTSGVYFFAFTGVIVLISYFWPTLFTARQKVQFLGMIMLVVLALIGYFLYHEHLNKAYGSGLFLNTTLPISSWPAHRAIWTKIWIGWISEYFTHVDYALLKISWGLLVVYAIVQWRHASAYLPLLALFGVTLLGITIMYLLLGIQLVPHDYYIIAPLFPLLMMVLCSALWILCKISGERGRLLITVLLLVATVAPTVAGLRHHRARMHEPYSPYSEGYVYRWELGGAEKLRKLGVPESSFILVMGEGPSNLALIHFNRPGIVWNPDIGKITADTVLRLMAGRRLEYLIMRRDLLDQIKQQNPALLTPFREVNIEDQSAILQPLQRPVKW